MERLENISQDLFRLLQSVDLKKQQEVAIFMCKKALAESGVQESSSINLENYASSGLNIAESSYDELCRLALTLEEGYFSAQEHNDDKLTLKLFRQARAVASVCFLLQNHPKSSIADSIYEALLVFENPKDFLEETKSLLLHQ